MPLYLLTESGLLFSVNMFHPGSLRFVGLLNEICVMFDKMRVFYLFSVHFL
jgi:hypothetical protein